VFRFGGNNGKYSLFLGAFIVWKALKQAEHKLRPDAVEPSEEELKKS